CLECRRSFTWSSDLVVYQQTHTRATPYQCHKGGRCFNRSSSPVTHQRMHTSKMY
ncbi:ZN180 protein, partial [Atlantisia rogersi]|nr:ZN180 protein [Atlantisia rogersi]